LGKDERFSFGDEKVKGQGHSMTSGQRHTELEAVRRRVLITPPPVVGRGIVLGDFFFCFFVSNITRKRLERFA